MVDQAALCTRYIEEITLWQKFLEEHGTRSEHEDRIFEDMAFGFFMGQGIKNEILGGKPYADAADLAYTFGG